MIKSILVKALQFLAIMLVIFNLTLSSAWAQDKKTIKTTSPSSSPTPAEQVKTDKRSSSRRQEGPVDPYDKYHKAFKKYNEEVYGKRG